MRSAVFDMISGKNKSETSASVAKKRLLELDEEDDEEEIIIKKVKKAEPKKVEKTDNKKIEKLVKKFIENHELVVQWDKWFDKQLKKGKKIEVLEKSEEFEEFLECVKEANVCFTKIKETIGKSKITIEEILKGEIA